jgi:hypothetical protein
MNKRDFLKGSAGAALASAAVASSAAPAAAAGTDAAGPSTGRWLGRTERHPDLMAAPCADRFEAYVGEVFATVGGVLRVAAVTRKPGGPGLEQFDVRFEAVDGTLPAAGIASLAHASGQRLALHLQPADGRTAVAHFSLLA